LPVLIEAADEDLPGDAEDVVVIGPSGLCTLASAGNIADSAASLVPCKNVLRSIPIVIGEVCSLFKRFLANHGDAFVIRGGAASDVDPLEALAAGLRRVAA